MIYYVCKYTPIELFRGFGEECSVLEEMPENFEQSDQIAHANLCGFGKSVIQAVRRKRDEAAGLKHLYRYFRQIFTGRGCGQFVDHSLFIRVFAGFKLVFIGPIKEFFVGGFRVIVISH